MIEGVVETFELESETFKAVGRHATLAEASAELPPGAYTTLRTYGPDRVLRLEQHLRRLTESVGERRALDAKAVRRALGPLVLGRGHEQSRIRLSYAPPRLFASVEPFEPLPPGLYKSGVAAVTVPLRRGNPRAKDTRFLAEASRAYAALPPGVNEGLMVAEDGSLLEGLSSNFFAVLGGELRTEDARVLAGVTRAVVLEVAEGLMPVRLEAPRLAELHALRECFLTSVSREILPVVAVDGQPIGDGRPGPRTAELIRLFAELVEREAEPIGSA